MKQNKQKMEMKRFQKYPIKLEVRISFLDGYLDPNDNRKIDNFRRSIVNEHIDSSRNSEDHYTEINQDNASPNDNTEVDETITEGESVHDNGKFNEGNHSNGIANTYLSLSESISVSERSENSHATKEGHDVIRCPQTLSMDSENSYLSVRADSHYDSVHHDHDYDESRNTYLVPEHQTQKTDIHANHSRKATSERGKYPKTPRGRGDVSLPNESLGIGVRSGYCMARVSAGKKKGRKSRLMIVGVILAITLIAASSVLTWYFTRSKGPTTTTATIVYFTEAGVTAEIGSDFELQCILGGNLANNDVVISRKTINKEENICTVKSFDTVVCSPAHISGNATFSENDRVVTINIDAAECDDEGTYFCASVNDTSFNTSINVSLTKLPAWKPTLSLPIRMVVEFLETFSSISCNAAVGYPPGDLRLEYSRDNSTSYSTFDIGTAGAPVETKEGCSVNKSISYSRYTYTQSWNNTSVRCAVYGSTNASDAQLIVSDVQTISLIVNECPSEGIFYMNHPLNCHYLITCLHGLPTVGNDCRSNCPNILSNTTAPHCDGNCTMLALTTGCIDSLD